jgi:hypothetical protein
VVAKLRFGFARLFVAVLFAFALSDANGQPPPYTLTSNNSMLDIDPSFPDTVYNWWVEGVDHLVDFSNYYRVGNGREFPLSTVPVIGIDDSQPDRLVVTHKDVANRFTVEVTYGVFGGAFGSGYSSMGECVTITNLTAGLLNFHLFEYMNLDLDTTPGDDRAYRFSPTQLNQDDIGTAGTTFNVLYGTSSHHEVAYTPSLLSRLNDGVATTLQDIPATLNTTIGPDGDMEFALQYDIILMGGGSHTICKDCELQMHLIPEPAGGVLGMIGGLAMGWLSRQRRYSPSR